MANNKNSQYDAPLIVKEVHDFHGQFLRTGDAKSVVPEYFSHFRTTYDLNQRPTQVLYYRGTLPHITNIGTIADVSGSLNNTFVTIYAAPSNQQYHIWLNVDSIGVDPAPANSIPIEVQISENDPSIVVATAIALTINSLFNKVFVANRNGSVVNLTTKEYGVVTNSTDFSTNFVIQNTPGTQELVKQVDIGYIGIDPVYQGQVLVGYYYDIYSGKFEKNAIDQTSTSNVLVQNKLFTKAYNKLSVLSKNDDGNPLQVESFLNGTPIQLANIQYDADGDFLEVEVSDL